VAVDSPMTFSEAHITHTHPPRTQISTTSPRVTVLAVYFSRQCISTCSSSSHYYYYLYLQWGERTKDQTKPRCTNTIKSYYEVLKDSLKRKKINRKAKATPMRHTLVHLDCIEAQTTDITIVDHLATTMRMVVSSFCFSPFHLLVPAHVEIS
jgi:hypothetical protein